MGGAKANTALTIHTAALVSKHTFFFLVEAMYPVGALFFAQAAAYAPGRVADNLKWRINIVDTH